MAVQELQHLPALTIPTVLLDPLQILAVLPMLVFMAVQQLQQPNAPQTVFVLLGLLHQVLVHPTLVVLLNPV
jgi:hypothetical protein